MATTSPRQAALIKQTVHWRGTIERSFSSRHKTAPRKVALCIVEGLVFLKLARQRRLESATIFSRCLRAENIVCALHDLFARAREKYRSTVFDLPPLPASPKFERALRKIVQKIRAFRIGKMEASILGRIYETDTDGSRKGVYFTPDFISDYLVSRTLAPLQTKKKSPRVLDPACGAGAFPLKIFERLVKATGCEKSLARKRRVLLRCVHGVDIDAFGVELTRLSLLLKLYEGTAPAANDSPPDLSRNIRCGNTLVSSPFSGTSPLLWPSTGFDAVIVNPPYVGVREMTREHGVELKRYLARKYVCARGEYLLYAPFLERSLALLRSGGRLGIVVPTSWAVEKSAANCRKLILNSTRIENIADISQMCVFSKTSVYPHILICQKTPPAKVHRIALVEAFSPADLRPGAAASSLQQASLSYRNGFRIH